MSVLDKILASTRTEVARRKQVASPVLPENSDRSFAEALARPGLGLIAEIKRQSPSRGPLRPDFDPAAIAAAYDGHASAISVLTDEPFFGGHRDYLGVARTACSCPLLAKDFFVDEFQIHEARAAGADAILLMASVLPASEIERFLGIAHSLAMEALVEVHGEAELETVLAETSANIVGVNSRDLRTLEIDESTIFRLAPQVRDAGKIMVAESGIFTRSQVDRLREVADAVLIGTSFMLAPDIGQKLKELGW